MMCRGDLVIEPFVAGDSYGFEGYVRNGVFRHFTGHRRLLEFPLKGGSSVLRELASKDSINQMHQICSSVVQKLRVTGFIMFEFKRTPQGVFILLECNPRIWGSINQALLSEPNLFNDLFGSIQYRKREANNIHTDNWPLSWFIFLLSLFKRTFKQNLILFSVLLRSKHDVSFKLDRFNFFGYLWKMLN